MKVNHRLSILLLPALLFAGGCSKVEFTHVKPGQSARLHAMTRTAPLGQPIAKPVPGQPGAMSAANAAAIQPLPDIVPMPALPDPNNVGEKVAELYTRGSFAMQAGQTGEAIIALEEAVQLDPNFSDAWSKLVILYQKAGKEDQALQAYKKAKKLGQPNGPSTLTPPSTSALIPQS
jgi:hypothetical protein